MSIFSLRALCRTVFATSALLFSAFHPAVASPIGGLSVLVGETVQLDASSAVSVDANETYRFEWTLTDRPASSLAAISDIDLLRPTIDVDVAGEYLATLRVYEQTGGGEVEVQAIDLIVSTDNFAPVAAIGLTGLIGQGQPLLFDGSGSFDATPDTLTYQWSVTDVPLNSSLSAVTSTGPRFALTPDMNGDYEVSLSVEDGSGLVSELATYAFSTQDGSAPVADTDWSMRGGLIGETLVLDSFDSTDTDGDFLTGEWSLVYVPTGSVAEVTDRSDGRIELIADVAGDYLLQLYVTDEDGEVSTDTILYSVDASTAPNIAPVARILNPTIGVVGAEVALDGRQSFDLDGDALEYTWSLLSRPVASAIFLADANTPSAAFTPDVEGDYVVQLTVVDATGLIGIETLLISTDTVLPLAVADSSNAVSDNGTGDVDGSGAISPTGATLAYDWDLIGLLGTSDQTLLGGTSGDIAQAIYLGLETTIFKDELTRNIVYHDWDYNDLWNGRPRHPNGDLCRFSLWQKHDVDVSTVYVPGDPLDQSQGDVPPGFDTQGYVTKADGSQWQVWRVNQQYGDARNIRLELDDGSWSYDFVLLGGVDAYIPAPVSSATMLLIVNGNQERTGWPNPNPFQRTEPVCLGFQSSIAQLTVNAGGLYSYPDTVYVGAGNHAPVAQNVADILATSGQPVALDVANIFVDPEGDALNAHWSILSAPAGSTATVNGAGQAVVTGDTASFTPDLGGIYLVQVAVDDGDLAAKPVIIQIEISNSAPVADAGSDQNVFVGGVALLNGAASSDPDGDPITFAWNIVSAPAGSIAVLSDATATAPTLTPDLRGTYVIELVVSDAAGTSQPDQVIVTVPNRSPVVVLDGATEVETGSIIGFFGGNSSDPDGDALTFLWTISAAPTGSTATLNILDVDEVDFTPDLDGDYTVTLTVSDGLSDAIINHNFSTAEGNNPPVLGGVLPTYSVEVGEHLAIELTASDANGGDTLSFFALPLPLPDGMTIDATTGTVHFLPETGQEGVYNLTFGVSDEVLTDTVSVTITVMPADSSDTTVAGRVLDAVDFENGIETPLVGIPVRLKNAALVTVTDANGEFQFATLTGGNDKVLVEPSATGGPGGFTSEQRGIIVTQDQDKLLDPPFLLGRLDGGCVTVNPALQTVLTSASLSVTVTIPANSITDAAGDPYTGDICLGSLPQKFDLSSLPSNTNACLIYALDAPGARFDDGMVVSAPNLDGLPGEAELEFWQLYDSLGRFLPSSSAQVNVAGTTVSTTGPISESTLFTFLPHAPSVVSSDDQPNSNHTLNVFEGDLAQSYALTGYRSFNMTQSVGLAYHSSAADPNPIVSGDVTIGATSGLPVTLDSILNVGGLNITGTAEWTPRIAADGTIPALLGEAVTLRQSTPFDATGLPSGRYDYEFIAQAHYDCSTVAATLDGDIYVRNETNSPFGNGWSVEGLQKLTVDPDGDVTIMTDSEVVPFNAEPGLTEIDTTLSFPIEFGYINELHDMDNNGFLDVVFVESDEARIRVLYNFGNREFVMSEGQIFGDPHQLPGSGTGVYPDISSLSLGNLLGSEKGTIITTSQFSGRVQVLRFQNYENIRLLANLPTPSSVNVFEAVKTVDLDNNGDDDILYSSAGAGIFSINTIELNALYFTGNNYVGENEYSTSTRDTDVFITQIEMLDFDNNGFVDIITRTQKGISIFLNTGGRTFNRSTYGGQEYLGGVGPQRQYGDYMAIGDYNGDGMQDIAYSANTTLTVFFSEQGDAFTSVVVPLPVGVNALGSVTTLDANGDGLEDLIYNNDNDVVLFQNTGTQQLLPGEVVDLGHGVLWGSVSDLDQDGFADLISVNSDTLDIDFFKSDSNSLVAAEGEFSTLVAIPAGGWVRTYKDGTSVEFNADGFQTATVDTQGNSTTYAYDIEGRLTTITDQIGGVTTYAYGASGLLESITDPQGRVTLFEHDIEGDLATITEPDTGTIQFEYDDNNRLISTTNQRGKTTDYSYDGQGRIAGTNFPDGSSILNQVGATLGLVDGLGGVPAQPYSFVAPENRTTTLTDQKGNDTQLTVNQFGSPIKIVDPLGRTTIMQRDGRNLVTRLERPSDAVGTRVDTMAYDLEGNLATLTEAFGTPLERTTLYTYEYDFNKLLTMTDPDGFVTSYEYDTDGEVAKITDAEDGERLFTYTLEGKIATRTDENGNVTTFTYNTDLNLASITYADGSLTELTYDAQGNLITIAEAVGTPIERQTHRTFDIDNYLTATEVTAADGTTINGQMLYDYDILGNLTSTTDETGLVTSYTYDEHDRISTIDDPAEGLVERIYNLAGEVTEDIDSEGNSYVYTYDKVGRMTSTLDPEANTAIFTYDVSDNVTSVTDGRSNTTTFGYDALERTITRTNPLLQTITRGYDLRNNLTSMTREDGVLETALYDDISRRISVTTPDNALTYGFDPVGNLTSATDSDSAVSFGYDLRNRLETTTTDGTVGPQPASTLTYTYDVLDRRVSLSDHLGGATGYTYDVEGRLSTLTSPWGSTHTMTYDEFGRRTGLTSTTGRNTSMGYYNGLLSSLTHMQNAVTLSNLAYDYAVDGQLIGVRDLIDPAKSIEIDYDDLNRLRMVSEGIPTIDGGTPIPVEDYDYDGEGNRISSHLSSLYLPDDHNRLEEDSDYNYGYDPKGNRTSRTAKVGGVVETYTFNSANRLIAYDSGTGTVATYTYDAMGRRIAKVVDGVETSYVYDPWALQASTANNILLEYQDGTLKRRWLHSTRIDEPLAFEDYNATTDGGTGATREVFADRQGSILAIVDPATGTVISQYEYDSFGKLTQTVGSLQQPYGFTGREQDVESGLMYFRARTYDPAIGQFIQQDPIGFNAGDLNLYAYVSNNPFNLVDPSGLTSSASYATHTAASSQQSKGATTVVRRGALCAASSTASLLSAFASYVTGGFDMATFAYVASAATCKVKASARKRKPRKRKCTCAGGGVGRAAVAILGLAMSFAPDMATSFAPDTVIETPNGPVAISELLVGDMVIARNEETQISGVFPVTQIFSRVSEEILWLTLEDADDKQTRIGITPEHPLFDPVDGWEDVGDMQVGDVVLDGSLDELLIVAVEHEDKHQMVYNLEIEGAHTYYAGELQVWAHNAWYDSLPWLGYKNAGPISNPRQQLYNTRTGKFCAKPSLINNPVTHFVSGLAYGYADGRGFKPNASPLQTQSGRRGYSCGFVAGTIDRNF